MSSDNVDAGICLNNTALGFPLDPFCEELFNSNTILGQANEFLAAKGIPLSDYDIGHSLTTGSGGLASYRSLCTRFKAQGRSGNVVLVSATLLKTKYCRFGEPCE